jgi:hypothetical protein
MLEEKLLVLIPGADVATEYYTDPMKAVQEWTNLNLWVVIPAFPEKLCIDLCATSGHCGLMHDIVERAINKAVDQGYKGPTSEIFMAGHSLGGVCAATYTEAY